MDRRVMSIAAVCWSGELERIFHRSSEYGVSLWGKDNLVILGRNPRLIRVDGSREYQALAPMEDIRRCPRPEIITLLAGCKALALAGNAI